MKAILEFDLDDLQDKESYAAHNQCIDLHIASREFDEFLRCQMKYGDYKEEVFATIEKIRDRYLTILSECDINLDVLS